MSDLLLLNVDHDDEVKVVQGKKLKEIAAPSLVLSKERLGQEQHLLSGMS